MTVISNGVNMGWHWLSSLSMQKWVLVWPMKSRYKPTITKVLNYLGTMPEKKVIYISLTMCCMTFNLESDLK